MELVQLNMANGIREFGRATPERTAVIDGDRSLSFADLDDRSNRLASGLLERGVRQGDFVALLSGNRMEYFEIAAALSKVGMPLVPLNSKNTSADNEYIINHSGARVLILDSALAAGIESFHDDLDHVFSFDGAVGESYEEFLSTSATVDPQLNVGEDDPFCITYTSGTTGKPKGVILTHRGRVLTNYAAAIEFGIGPSKSTVAVAPLYHGAGFAFAYVAPQLGATVSVLRSWDPKKFLQMLQDSRSNTVFLVPTHAEQIRRIIDEPMVEYDLSALETLYFNAAALPVALKEWVHQAFPGVGIHEVYGSTECSIVTDLRPEDSMRKAGSVGHAWFMNEVKLLDEAGQEVPPNTPGELFARSPLLMKGYLHDEEATRAATNVEGFVTVGDIAVRDEEGFISIVDRKKDMIIAGGVNIFPREIEEVVAKHPDVGEVAVVGVPDDVYGERIAAFVVARKDAGKIDVAVLEAHVRANVAKHKVPREWHILEVLPHNPSGKILKRDIRSDYINDRSTAAE